MAAPGITTGVIRPDPRLVVRTRASKPKVRRIFRIPGGALPREFGVHNNDVTNLARGLTERVFNVEVEDPVGGKRLVAPPKPSPGHFRTELAACFDILVKKLPAAVPRTLERVVADYEGDRRLKVYTLAAESLRLLPVHKDDARLTTFVKAEKIDLVSKGDPAPRVIQPRTPRYNLEVGRYLKHLEKPIYNSIGRLWGSTTVFKGLNGVDRARELRKKWDRFNYPVAVGLDASRFDQHVSPDALRWEHKVYKACFSSPSDKASLAELLSWQVRNKGVGRAWDGSIRYEVEGCRMSGDMNTAMGNCLLMSCLVWTWCKKAGVVAELANDGDDCVVICESHDLGRFQRGLYEWFKSMGFTMKIEEPASVFEEIEFCQCHPVWTEGGWVMVRDPRKALAKDLHSVLPLDVPNMARGLCTAMGMGGAKLCAGVPVCQSFYQALVRLGEGKIIGRHPALESGFSRLCAGLEDRAIPVTDEARVSFWRAFGILPSEQLMLEDSLGSWQVDWTVEQRENTVDPTGFWQYYRFE